MKPTKQALKTFKTKSDAYSAGYNHGLEDGVMKRPANRQVWIDLGGRIQIVGVIYSDYQLVLGDIPEGTVLDLIGEPSNTHDNRAIRLEYKGIKLGYIPKGSWHQINLWIAHQEGRKCIAIVTSFYKSHGLPGIPWITVQLKVKTLPTDSIPPKDIKL